MDNYLQDRLETTRVPEEGGAPEYSVTELIVIRCPICGQFTTGVSTFSDGTMMLSHWCVGTAEGYESRCYYDKDHGTMLYDQEFMSMYHNLYGITP